MNPDSPEDLERIWNAREEAERQAHEAWLEREERMDMVYTRILGTLALLGLWKAYDLMIAVLFWFIHW